LGTRRSLIVRIGISTRTRKSVIQPSSRGAQRRSDPGCVCDKRYSVRNSSFSISPA
jgi:hypothetical protein